MNEYKQANDVHKQYKTKRERERERREGRGKEEKESQTHHHHIRVSTASHIFPRVEKKNVLIR